MIEVSFQFESLDDLRQFLATRSGGPTVAEASVTELPPAPKPSSNGAAPKAAKDPEPQETGSQPTIQQVRDAVLTHLEAHGRESVKQVLAKFGAERANDVAPQQFAELIEVLSA